MAAPTDAGYEESVELDKSATGLGLSAEDPIGFDEKNGSEEEDVQVAKKARVEKTIENGANDATADDVVDDEDAAYGVEGFVDKDSPELDPLVAHNGTGEDEERINGEADDEDDEENGGVGVAEEDEEAADGAADPVATGKDASAGDVGLRTLLQEGDAPKTGHLNGAEDATHMLNGAK